MNPIEQIMIGSPWWTDSGWSKKDRHIAGALKSGIKMRHIERYQIRFPSVEIIRGPRQIGKTTEIKMIIEGLIDKGRNPRAIGYFTCDVISRHKELFEILKSFSQHLKLSRMKNGFLFLDEVSSIKDWQKAIKAFVDTGMGEGIHLAVTGSSSIELKRGYERMPGRRNGGKDYLFLPVSFRKFCALTHPKKDIPRIDFTEILKSEKKFEEIKEAVLIDSAFYKKSFMDYARIGGFPKPISDFVKHGNVSDETLLINRSVLFSEFEKYKKNINTLMQILGELIKNIATPVSFNTIMKNIELASAKTVKEYIETLTQAYLGLLLPCVDISKKKIFHKRDKKIYLMDPIIFAILRDRLGFSPLSESNFAENMCCVHIGRFFLKDWADLGTLDKLFYWKSAKGNEVDFVIFQEGKPFGIEVKYQNVVSPWDEMSIRRGIGRGIIVTKDTFAYGEISKIPLWAFLLIESE